MIYSFIRRVLLTLLILLTLVFGLSHSLFLVMAVVALFQHHVMGEAPRSFPHGGPREEDLWLPALIVIALNIGLWRVYFWFYRKTAASELAATATGQTADEVKP